MTQNLNENSIVERSLIDWLKVEKYRFTKSIEIVR